MGLETERLILRPWELEDAEALYELAKDTEVGPACGWPPHTSVDESRSILEKVLMNDYTYAIVLKESGQIIGDISRMPLGVSRLCENEHQIEIGFWLGRAYWGNGYMPEACKCILKECFEILGIEKVWCAHSTINDKSKRVQEKCGFAFEFLDESRSMVVNSVTSTRWEDLKVYK